MQAIKVLIVDDNAAFMRAAILTLNALPGVTVVGAARTGPEALPLVPLHQPDLILMDVHMPVMNGVRTASRLRAQGTRAKIVFVSLGEAPVEELNYLNVVPDGFISKADFAAGIQRVLHDLFPSHQPCGAGAR